MTNRKSKTFFGISMSKPIKMEYWGKYGYRRITLVMVSSSTGSGTYAMHIRRNGWASVFYRRSFLTQSVKCKVQRLPEGVLGVNFRYK